ncbi:Uncharacterized protein FWK35_00028784, partial [Aphis craccivora]
MAECRQLATLTVQDARPRPHATHVKSEIKRLRGRPLIISPDGRIRLMNNYSYIKTRDLLLKMFEKKPDHM